MNIEKFTIFNDKPLKEALIKINELPIIQTIFVLNKNGELVGTLTDGDIRRGLIKGLQLDDSLDKYMHTTFSCLVEGENNFGKLKELRERRLKAVPMINHKKQIVKIYDFSVLKSILPVDAVIMAGGKGQRLMPLTKETPKPLLKIGNKEIIAYNFDHLYRYGIQNQHITINYLGGQIREFCNAYNPDINFNIIEEPQFLGTAGALSLVEDLKNETVLLMNSDLLTNVDYEDMFRSFINKQADMMVASVPYTVNLPYAIFETNDREVLSFKEKPNYTYYANAGIYMFKKELLNLIPSGSVYNATDFMNDVVKQNKKLAHYPIRSYWLDIGKHEDFDKAQKDIAHIDFD